MHGIFSYLICVFHLPAAPAPAPFGSSNLEYNKEKTKFAKHQCVPYTPLFKQLRSTVKGGATLLPSPVQQGATQLCNCNCNCGVFFLVVRSLLVKLKCSYESKTNKQSNIIIIFCV